MEHLRRGSSDADGHVGVGSGGAADVLVHTPYDTQAAVCSAGKTSSIPAPPGAVWEIYRY